MKIRVQNIAFLTALAIAAPMAVIGIAQRSPREQGLAHIAAAKKAAGYDNAVLFDHTCSRLLVGAALPYGRIPPPPNDRDPKNFHTEPVKVFDNLYYVGEKMQHGGSPSAWALVTPEGIILIDTMFENSMHDEILGGFTKLNLDPADIKYILISHNHQDHTGGLSYLQSTYHPKVIMGGPDWDAALRPNARGGAAAPPIRDISASDGQKVTLGGVTITLYVTPGHTAGTVSMLIPVMDKGVPHLAALWGGTGMQFSAADYSAQAARFRTIAAKAGADVVLSTHSQLDGSDMKLPLILKRRPGDPNPYVVGTDVVQGYMSVAHECGAAAVLMPEEYKGYLGRSGSD